VLRARQINQAAGGTVIAPWEVDDLPDEWIDTIAGFSTQLPDFRATQRKIDDRLNEWRKRHPGYRYKQ
jgi:hypothetical protein